ncbi:hypothetical protein CsSME_00040674 [Camellia sinensis var. sinensis]
MGLLVTDVDVDVDVARVVVEEIENHFIVQTSLAVLVLAATIPSSIASHSSQLQQRKDINELLAT